jgi:phosphomannomutase
MAGAAVLPKNIRLTALRRCAQGFATYLQQKGLAEKGVVIGHDQRFHADNFAAAAAEVLAANGISVWLTDGATPDPTISYAAVDKQAGGAINITASHNPPWDCGFKVRDPQGGAIAPAGFAMRLRGPFRRCERRETDAAG